MRRLLIALVALCAVACQRGAEREVVDYVNNRIGNISHLLVRQMIRQVSRGSAGEYQADERAGVARLIWRVSG